MLLHEFEASACCTSGAFAYWDQRELLKAAPSAKLAAAEPTEIAFSSSNIQQWAKNSSRCTRRHPHHDQRSSSPGNMATHGDIVDDARQKQGRRPRRRGRRGRRSTRSLYRPLRHRRLVAPNSVEHCSHCTGARRAQEPGLRYLDLRKPLPSHQRRRDSPQHRRKRCSVFLEPGVGGGARVLPIAAVAADNNPAAPANLGGIRRRGARKGACGCPRLFRVFRAGGTSGAVNRIVPAASSGSRSSSEPSKPTRCPKVHSCRRTILQDGCQPKKRVTLEGSLDCWDTRRRGGRVRGNRYLVYCCPTRMADVVQENSADEA